MHALVVNGMCNASLHVYVCALTYADSHVYVHAYTYLQSKLLWWHCYNQLVQLMREHFILKVVNKKAAIKGHTL